jgi:hypothetical protein
MAKLTSLTLSGGDALPFKAANKEGGLFSALFSASHSQLPRLTSVACVLHHAWP